MIEAFMQNVSQNSTNVEDIIFSLLSQENSLSLMELYNKIKRNNIKKVKFQTIKNAVETLNEQNIINKNNKKYSLNQEWILDMRNFLDKLIIKQQEQ